MSSGNYIHGSRTVSNTSSTYKTWCGMKQRCDNPNKMCYSYYGGRGISYDPAWKEFVNFLSDMGERPTGMTLDRIDSNKKYCKDNCRWATSKQQASNRRLSSRNISGHTGITWDKWNSRWLVMIKNKNLGRYKAIEDAIKVKYLYLGDNN